MSFYKNPYFDPQKPHHTPQGFRNPDAFSIPDASMVIRWYWNRLRYRLPKSPRQGYAQFRQQWLQPVNWQVKGDQVWWLGHATLLWRLGTRHVLTDPIFSQRSSPYGIFAPKRLTPPACSIDELPVIDVVVISHNHHDHFDAPSIKKLSARFPELICLVPLGMKKALQRIGVRQVYELDWEQNFQLDELTIHCVPAFHWSQRSLNDRNRSLWCGWVLQHADRYHYFPGDTGYNEPMWHKLHQQFPKLDTAALPLGAYAPRWMMHYQHMDPHQSLLTARILNCRQAIGMHWATFALSDEPLDEPPQWLQQELDKPEFQDMQFHIVKNYNAILSPIFTI